MKGRVLITGCGCPGAPGIIKCLKEQGLIVIGTDMRDDLFAGRKLVNRFYNVPGAYDKNYISAICDICQKEKIDTVIPLTTQEVLVLSKIRDTLHVAVSHADTVKNVIDKYLLYCMLPDISPFAVTVRTRDEFWYFYRKIYEIKGQVCFKPLISNGSRGFRVVGNKKWDDIYREKPSAIYITESDIKNILPKRFNPLLLMEYLSGEEYTVDVLYHNYNPIIIVPRLRLKITEGITHSCIITQNKEIENLVSKISKEFSFSGNIGFQFRRDKDGCLKLIECNPRLQGTTVACLYAGVNMPYFGYCESNGIKYDIPEIKYGTKVVRYYDEVYEL